MELSEATKKAGQILDEERSRPTVTYVPADPGNVPGLSGSPGLDALVVLGQIGTVQHLTYERQARPRRVHESPDEFQFESTNHELLLALFSQVSQNDRPAFVGFLLGRVPSSSSARRVEGGRFPSWNGNVSELPLVAEFCVRVGFKEELLEAVGELQLTAGYAVLLLQVEDMLALNFNLFSDCELEQLGKAVATVRTKANRKRSTYSPRARGPRFGVRERNPEYDARFAYVATQIVAECEGIIEECKQARYWYLKGALQQNANLEVNLDKAKVEGYLKNLGFSSALLGALDSAERDYRAAATPFELKNSLGHLRSFLEGLHEQACSAIAGKAGTTAPRKWGKTTEFLRNQSMLSSQEEGLAASLYTLISDEGVHTLIAEREYARLLRNMAIEYGLLFLSKLEKAGIKLP